MESYFGRTDQEFLKRLVSAGVKVSHVFDIGASNGIWSLTMAQTIPCATFDLFEPNESQQYAEMLKTTLEQRPDFRMHRVGLGDRDTTLDLNLSRDHVGSSLLDWDGGYEKKRVPVRRLDRYVADKGLPSPDLIKMDTQGFELRIVAGGERACAGAKALLIETWLYRAYGGGTPLTAEIIEWLEPRGLVLCAFGDSWTDPDGKLISIDAYFLRKDVAAQVAAAESAQQPTN